MSDNQSFALEKYETLKKGVYIREMTSELRFYQLCKKIHPAKTKFELIRIGGELDGGYLVPNDLVDIKVCFSPGVDVTATFELDLHSRFGINSHLADYSVSGPPMNFKASSFLKKFIGAYDNEQFTTLDNWVRQQDEFSLPGDFILQMDIEGAEYIALLGVSEEVLNRFRVLIIEFHNVKSWGEPVFFGLVETLFDKLLKNFNVLHNHPNNCCDLVNLGRFVAPRVFELTLLRKDRADPVGFCDKFPHALDRPNHGNKDDLILPNMWYNF